MSKMLVVLSGGQDSTTCLYWALEQVGRDPSKLRTLTIDYGQRHRCEVDAALRIAKLAGVSNVEVVSVIDILAGGHSPLVSQQHQLEQYSDYESMDKIIGDRVELTFVPMRNPLFLTIAANRAMVHDCEYIVTGVCEADNANYPDCRATFIESMNNMIRQAIGVPRAPQILAPLLNFSKAQSIDLALGFPGCYKALAFSHTAYDGKYPPVGKDHASVLRAHGFEEAGVPDPLVLRAWWNEDMSLPLSKNYDCVRGADPLKHTLDELLGLVVRA